MAGWPHPAAWARAQTPTALLVIRLLLVANSIMLTTIGALCLAFVARPAGMIAAVLVWFATGGLLLLIPYTNPRRGQRTRW